jgi:hypothetical protein
MELGSGVTINQTLRTVGGLSAQQIRLVEEAFAREMGPLPTLPLSAPLVKKCGWPKKVVVPG